MGARWLSDELNRSVGSVQTMAQKLKLPLEHALIKYTDEEVKYIKDNYGKLTAREIAYQLGRTTESIQNKVLRLRHENK